MGVVGGLAAAAAASVTRLGPVEAANGDTVKVGGSHTGTSGTGFETTATGFALRGKSSTGIGVVGDSDTGTGVLAESTSGIGITVQSFEGVGLEVKKGRIKVDQVSGVATIAKGRRSVVVTPGVDINASTFVLLTPRANIGARALWYTTNPVPNRFVIHLSSRRGVATKIAWLALETA